MSETDSELEEWKAKHGWRELAADEPWKRSDLARCPECGRFRICKRCEARIERSVQRVERGEPYPTKPEQQELI